MIANLARHMKIATVAVVATLPADKEGRARCEQARAALGELEALSIRQCHVKQISSDSPLFRWFDEADTWAVETIFRIITKAEAQQHKSPPPLT